ncbi:bifunctional diguanylate cyclase/phosphodiesterase [Paracidovorax avenae]
MVFFYLWAALAAAGALGFCAGLVRARLSALRRRVRDGRGASRHARTGSRPILRRAQLERRLQAAARQCAAREEVLYVFFLGLDGLKGINSQFGYAAGDWILRGTARRLQALPRAFDGLAYIGGDEFAAFYQGPLDRHLARGIAEAAAAAVAGPHDIAGSEVSVTCSIGVACYPRFRPASRLLAHAHLAMCAAKAKGRGGHAFYAGEGTAEAEGQADEALELSRDLGGAISRGELHLVFQPKIDARSGKITAVEALLRWTHPLRGHVPPDVFIPIAERFHLIDRIGDWVLEEACRQARKWRSQGLCMRVAVNLSAQQLRQPELAARIRQILDAYRIHPALLTCEITESVAVRNAEGSREALSNLEKAGVRISIDDFGTGYSSLSYLRQLPACELKIDRSFVSDLGESEHAYSIVDAVIRMSHALGKRVVAEGVGNRRQVEILSALGCDELQGYYFARPMPPERLLLWAKSPPDGRPGFHPAVFCDTQTQLRIA